MRFFFFGTSPWWPRFALGFSRSALPLFAKGKVWDFGFFGVCFFPVDGYGQSAVLGCCQICFFPSSDKLCVRIWAFALCCGLVEPLWLGWFQIILLCNWTQCTVSCSPNFFSPRTWWILFVRWDITSHLYNSVLLVGCVPAFLPWLLQSQDKMASFCFQFSSVYSSVQYMTI
jgi:hypothetical protein